MSAEIRTLHFDLSLYSPDLEFTLLAGLGEKRILHRYADHPSRLDEHRAANPALALLPEASLARITHFVEAAPLCAVKPTLRRVVFPSLDDHPLPEIALVFPHVPESHIAAAHARFWRDAPLPHLAEMSHYGVAHEALLAHPMARSAGDLVRLHIAAANVKPAFVTAQTIALNHPELGNVGPGVMEYLRQTYLDPTVNPDMSDFVQYIQQTSPSVGSFTWYNKSWAMWSADPSGKGTDLEPAELNTDLRTRDGRIDPDKWPKPRGKDYHGMPTYDLTDEYDPPAGDPANPGVIEAASATVSGALLGSKNDRKMNGILWNRQDGVTETAPQAPAPARSRAAARPAAMEAAPARGFSLKNRTSAYGLYLYDLSYDAGTKQLSFPVKNWPSRYLGAYVQFFRQDGTVIGRADIPGWPDKVPLEFVKPIMQPSDSKNYLAYMSSGAAIFGAPVPPLTQITDLAFPWPGEASRALILLGGLGCAAGFSDWDVDVDLVGTLATGIINYGVGAIMLLANVYIINPFIEFLKSEWGIGFFAICGFIGAAGVAVGVATFDRSAGKMILSKLSSIAASAVFGALANRAIMAGAKQAVEKFTEATAEMVAEMTAEEILEEVPVAGWALRVVSIAADVASLAATTVECVLSPATYSLEILHSMDLRVTVRPDPTHGKDGFAPVWPAVADHWVVQVRYPAGADAEGGTTFTQAGPMPGASDPIDIIFPGIPAGGKIEVTALVYSATDWIAGRWSSGWINAAPDASDTLATGGSIVEMLVPLTGATRYQHRKSIGYDATAGHYWQVVAFGIDAALVVPLDKGGAPDPALVQAFAGKGNALSAASSIAVTTPLAAWTLSDPTTGDSFAMSARNLTRVEVFRLPLATYKGALDASGPVAPAVSDAFSTAGHALPADAQVTAVAAGSHWTIAGKGLLPAFDLAAEAGEIVVRETGWEIGVENTRLAAPPLPAEYPLVAAASGNTLGGLQNIVHNNHQFQLGYAYLASGQNIPVDDRPGPTNAPIHAMQSISTLGSPQVQIYQPTRGFTQPVFLAYDQFGLTPLFVLDAALVGDLADGPVAAPVGTEFAAFGHPLDATAIVTTVTPGKSWTIGLPGDGPTFDLRLGTAEVDGKTGDQLQVFSYPVPGLDNFFLEPQPTGGQGVPDYHLRAVDLAKSPGEYGLDDADKGIWGVFSNPSPFQAVAVHPNGYAVALDNKNAKLFVVKLPAAACDAATAPVAMPLSGKGGLEGLMDGPQAMTVTADGRILVLETGTSYIDGPRIQAFDVKGNRVPCFSVNQPGFVIADGAAQIAADLDDRTVSQTLLGLFQRNFTPATGASAVIDSPDVAGVAADLDQGVVDERFIAVLVHYGLARDGDAPADFAVTVTEAGKLWYVSAKKTGAVWDVRATTAPNSGAPLIDIWMQFGLAITLRSAGHAWTIEDSVHAMTFSVGKAATSDDLTVQQLSSFMPLRPQSVTGTLTYLDLASETKGYVYVLSVIDNNYNSSHRPGDLVFQLDIYSPDGTPLLDAPQTGLNAGKITVDQYRSLYSLNFNVVIGPDTRTEPGVSQWTPSTPVPAGS